jgi:hypothetical protein
MIRRLAAVAVLLLAGCAASAQTRLAYVDVNALLRQHPLYGTLAQYDRQIAALEGTLHTGFANADDRIDHASNAVRAIASAPVPHVDPHIAVDLNESGGTDTSAIEQHMQQTYEAQYASLQGAAQHDMQAYRSALSGQQQSAYDAFVRSVDGRTARAITLRAQELRERESNLLLDLARSHAGRRLQVRAKLQTLALTGPARAAYQRQLAVLQAQENAVLARARSRDRATLDAYAAQMRSRAENDIAAFSTQLQTRSAANLAARERVMQSQTSGAGTLPMPAAPHAGSTGGSMQSAYNAIAGEPAPAPDFRGAANDITARWNDLRTANDAAVGQTRSQIDRLRHDREAVLKRMTAQIMNQAQTLAKSRGYTSVVAGRPAPGSPDLTPLVAAELRSLSP